MVGRDDHRTVGLVGDATECGDPRCRGEDLLGCGVAHGDDDRWLEVGDLLGHEGPARPSLLRRWGGVSRWTTPNQVRDRERIALEAEFVEHELAEEAARTTDEGKAGSILIGPRCFAEDEHLGRSRSGTDDRGGASGVEGAGSARRHLLSEAHGHRHTSSNQRYRHCASRGTRALRRQSTS